VTNGPGPLDRRAIVERHAVEVTGFLAESPLSVGNGELCFTVDVTGLQTFPDRYPVADPSGARPGTLLGTMSSWGWHSTPVAGHDGSGGGEIGNGTQAVGQRLIGGALEEIVLGRDVVTGFDSVTPRRRGGTAQMLDDGEISDPADDRAYRQAESRCVQGGEDR